MPSIAFIHPFIYRYPRGIERYTLNLANSLVQFGAEVDILTWRWSETLTWPELGSSINIYKFPTSRYYAAHFIVPFYVSHLLRRQYDRLYIYFADYGEAPALRVIRLFGRAIPFSIVLHFPYSQVPHRYKSLRNTGLFQKAQEVIAVSRFVAQEAEAFCGRHCSVITHGVDAKHFRPNGAMRRTVREELNIVAEAPILLTVAALEERKGVQWVLQALPMVLEERPETQYIVVGEGPHRQQLLTLARRLAVDRATHFLMAKTDVARFYQAADLFLILANGEASSIVSLEAMACAVPVISSCAPPFDELVDPGWGQQVSEQDSRALAAQILDLLTNEDRRREMGRRGRKHILRQHTWDGAAREYLELLN